MSTRVRDRSMCNDWGDPDVHDCLGKSDPQYNMDYTDVKPGEVIRWCANCGPLASKMNEAILGLKGQPDKIAELTEAIDAVERIQNQ